MWYVIQVFSGQENAAKDLIERLVDKRCYDEVFVPRYRSSRKAKDGSWESVLEPLTPGYIIVDTRDPARLGSQLRRVPALTKLLGGGEAFLPLDRDERAWIEAWTQHGNRVLESSEAVFERGRVRILDGPLIGREADIVRVNRRRRQAIVRMTFMGREKDVTLGLDVVGTNSARGQSKPQN